MSIRNEFETRVYRIRRADGRERYVATDRPWAIDLGPYHGELLSVELVRTEDLTPYDRAILRAAIDFDAQTVRRDRRDEYVSWILATDARIACILEAAQAEFDLLEWALVDCTEYSVVTDDRRPPSSATLAWGSP